MSADLRVQFVHGLEGSPEGRKARYLSERFEALTPDMDTSDFEACVRLQSEVLATHRPRVLIGSSFGGAVVVRLLADGVHAGPALLLAQAAQHFLDEPRLPSAVRVWLVHGVRDDVVDIAGSRQLAATSTAARLIELDDDHALRSITEDETLADWVRELAESS